MGRIDTRRRIDAAKALLVGAALLAATLCGAEAKWPMEKPMTLIVPWPAGSSFDVVARVIADGIHRKYGNVVVVDNRTGASGNIGQAAAARAKPDGYTFIVTTPGPAANNALTFKSLPYDPLTDFSFIGVTNRDPSVLVVRSSLKIGSFKEFIAYAKANPGAVRMGSPGNGTYSHMTQLALQDLAGVEFNIVPYRGPPQVLQDLLGGHLDAGMGLVGNYMPQVQSGQIKVLAVFGDRRDASLPNVPTLLEEGYKFSSQPWTGLQGPKGVPREIVVAMNQTVNEILKDRANVEKLASLGMTAAPSTPEEFEKLVRSEVDKWRPIVIKYKVSGE
ncbi:Bug family tripartite tricarboxylate transporter substrate binding protein [Variovorax saccharolyticus]|uniref:Bug family tripartite tricarboxylate transporter substrate binding protein n=1 Tax=Variovorax saccharolyticus TaxID=3053516 RepID=UPI002575FA42|nr:tripartite tricarboxylate transporter substrate binding protein [Variovorax sp. J22R187]MDM0021817.1 tripartite tricarboxylate transporter substrate binding protein [Variovorax sp. J22R187]